jgi:hypothetical protein
MREGEMRKKSEKKKRNEEIINIDKHMAWTY